MPNDYSINFTNKTGSNHMYGVFTEPPEAVPGIDKVYSNVWQSQQLDTDGSFDLKITKSTYACTSISDCLKGHPVLLTVCIRVRDSSHEVSTWCSC